MQLAEFSPNVFDSTFLYIEKIRYVSLVLNTVVFNKLRLVRWPWKLRLHDAICLTDSFVFTQVHCVNFKAIRYESTNLIES